MFCIHCGAKLSDDSIRCSECGTPVPAVSSSPAYEPQAELKGAQFLRRPISAPSLLHLLRSRMVASKVGLIVAATLALVIVGMGFSRVIEEREGMSNSGTGIMATKKEAVIDSKKNPTLYAIIELNGIELSTVLEDAGYSWQDENHYWARNNAGWFQIYEKDHSVVNNSAITKLGANGRGQACNFYVCMAKRDYSSAQDAFKRLVNVEVLDSVWNDNNAGFAVVKGPSGRLCFMAASKDDAGDYILDVYNEEAVSAGMCENNTLKGRTIPELWANVADRDLAGSAASLGGSVNPPKKGDMGSIGEGNYIVGVDIPAGEYKAYPRAYEDTGFYTVFDDITSTDDEDVVAFESFTVCSYVTLHDGQYIKLEHASLDPIQECKPSEVVKEENIYKVGVDLPAGTYALTAVDRSTGFYRIYTTSDFDADDSVTYGEGYACDYVTEPVEISLKVGLYIEFWYCDLTEA